jgi:hypothetical protein
MADKIVVPAYQRRRVYAAHAAWQRQLPRQPRQIGASIVTLVEGPPRFVPGQISTYSDFDDGNVIEFIVDDDFREFWEARGNSF